MWRIISLLLLPTWLLAQAVPLSLLHIEEDEAKHVLVLRNQYQADITAYVIAYAPEQGRRWSTQWDVAQTPRGEPIPPGGTRDLGPRMDDGARFAQPLAVIYSDGAYAGSFDLVRSILAARQVTAQHLQEAIGILTANSDAQEAIKAWSQTARARQARAILGRSRSVVMPIFGLGVPLYVISQLRQGSTQPEILATLRNWQKRFEEYGLVQAFV